MSKPRIFKTFNPSTELMRLLADKVAYNANDAIIVDDCKLPKEPLRVSNQPNIIQTIDLRK